MDENSDISISEHRLQQVGIIIGLSLLVFALIGYVVSPRDKDGQPILLLPEVKSFGDYQQSVKGWTVQINTLDSEISSVLTGTTQGDLFSQSHQTQAMLQHAVDLLKEIDQVKVPAAASGIHEQLYATALGYLETARLVMRWIGAPESATKEQINQKIQQVREMKAALEKSQWISQP
jgi:hypothetical protein